MTLASWFSATRMAGVEEPRRRGEGKAEVQRDCVQRGAKVGGKEAGE